MTSTEHTIRSGDNTILSSSQLSGCAGNWTVNRQTLRGGLQDGVELIHVDNGRLKFTVIPTRGMSIYQLQCGDVRLGWNSPGQSNRASAAY